MGRKSSVQKATEAELAKFNKNYAGKEDVVKRFLEQVNDPMRDARNNRTDVEDQWIDDTRQWSCVKDGMGYQGRANLFVPELNNQVEETVEKALATMFPASDFLHTVPMGSTSPEKADKIKKAVAYELEQKNEIFLRWEEFERSKVIYGTGVWKQGFKKEMNEVFYRDQETGKPKKESVPIFHGVTWTVLDIFKWYKWPEKGPLEDFAVIFEDDLRPIDEIEDNEDYVNNEDIQPRDQRSQHKWVELEQYEIVNLNTAIKRRPDHALVTEVWCHFKLDGKNKVLCRGTIVNDTHVVELIRCPFWHQKVPYLADFYKNRPGKMFYGFSMFDKLRDQGYYMNDLANHTADSLNYSLNPIAKIDPALAGDVNSFKVFPGAKWLGAPDGIKFEVFPDVSGAGLRAMQETRGQIAQFSDNSPGLAPQLEGKARSATQASIVQGSVTQRQRIQAMGEEFRIIKPMCSMTHSGLEQFMEDEWTVKYQGPDAGDWIMENISPGDIIGRVDWIWRGAIQQEKTAVRAQQLIAFFQLALQYAQMDPKSVNIPELYKRVAKEGFDLRDMDQYFTDLVNKKTVDPAAENIALEQGQEVNVNPGDDDAKHIEEHLILAEDESQTKEVRLATLQHIMQHETQEKAKKEVQDFENKMKAQQKVQEMQGPPQKPGQQGGQPQGGDGRQGPQVPGVSEGNRMQASTNPASIMSGTKGSQNL